MDNEKNEKLTKKLSVKYPKAKFEVVSTQGYDCPTDVKCLRCGTVHRYSRGQYAYRGRYFCFPCESAFDKLESFKNALKKKYPYDDLEVIKFTQRKEPGAIKCLKCGNVQEYAMAMSALNKTTGFFCKQCHHGKVKQRETTIEKYLEWGKNNPDFSLVDIPDVTQPFGGRTFKCKCRRCGKINEKTIYDYLRGDCCECVNPARPYTQQEVQDFLGDDYEIISSYKSVYDRITLRHVCGFEYKVIARNVIVGWGRCPKCSKKQSRGERAVKEFLEKNNIEYVTQLQAKVDGHCLYFDFYLPNQDVYIEYNGIQHYSPIGYFGGEAQLKRQQASDKRKQDFAKEKLITIPYTELENVDKILSGKLLGSTTSA